MLMKGMMYIIIVAAPTVTSEGPFQRPAPGARYDPQRSPAPVCLGSGVFFTGSFNGSSYIQGPRRVTIRV